MQDTLFKSVPISSAKTMEKIRETIQCVNALLNTDGGSIRLYIQQPKTNNTKKLDRCVDTLEKLLQPMIDIRPPARTLVSFEKSNDEILIRVAKSDTLAWVRSNMYFPTDACIFMLEGKEIGKAKRRKMLLNRVGIGRHETEFKEGVNCGLHESRTVQFKSVKHQKSGRTTLVDRIMGQHGDKLTHYISAFANYQGGHVYFGITDDGIVDAVKIESVTNINEKIESVTNINEKIESVTNINEKIESVTNINEKIESVTNINEKIESVTNINEEIEKKIEVKVKGMIWSNPDNQPRKGTHWDVHFEPVKNLDGETIEGAFVIVIFVAAYAGAVFTTKPEGYTIVNGKIEELNEDLSDWNIIYHQKSSMALNVPSIGWSSSLNKKIYRKLTMQLLHYRNENLMKEFRKFRKLAKKKYPKSCVSLVAMSESIAHKIKQQDLLNAKALISKFEIFLERSSDPKIFKVRLLYLKSRCARAEGKYTKSYDIATECIRNMEGIYPEYMTVWSYIHASTVASILSAKANVNESHSFSFYEQAKRFLSLARSHAIALEECEDNFGDLRHKLGIYQAYLDLGFTPAGDPISAITVTESKSAISNMSDIGGKATTVYRRIKTMLANCDLLYRYGQRLAKNREDPSVEYNKSSGQAKDAKILAENNNFQELVDHASRRIRRLEITTQVSNVEANFDDFITAVEEDEM